MDTKNTSARSKMDTLLSEALGTAETPSPELLRRVKLSINKEEKTMKRTGVRRSFGAVVTAALVILVASASVYAAWYYMKPSELAERFEDQALSAAFDSETAININESITSGDYIYTLLAVVSGEDISDREHYADDQLKSDRTYAVLAIQSADGTPMPDTSSEEYGKVSFFTSPLIKGLDPWRFNVFTMNGGSAVTVRDGITYHLLDCDNVAMFADRGLYFAVSAGSPFYNKDAFIYNPETGEIAANPSFAGSAVFNLPLDPALADPEKAEAYIADITGDFENPPEREALHGEDMTFSETDWESATVIESTVKVLTLGAEGSYVFDYDFEHGSGMIVIDPATVFPDGMHPQSKILHVISSDDNIYAVRITVEEDGTVKGMIIR